MTNAHNSHKSTEIAKGESIGISAISCFEVATAVAKGRIRLNQSVLNWLESALSQPRIELLPITSSVSVKATQLGNEFHGDPADRIILATTILESASLITKDSRIRKYEGVPTIW